MAQPIGKKRIHELETFEGELAGVVLLMSKDNKEYKLDASRLQNEKLNLACGTPFPKLVFQNDKTIYQINPYSDYDTYEVTTNKGKVSAVSRGSFTVMVGSLPIGEKVLLTVTRNGVPFEFEVTVSGPRVTEPEWSFPTNGSNLSATPTFTVTGYQGYPYNVNGNQQTAASWEISTSEDFSTTVFQSLKDTVNKTSISIPEGKLQTGQTYYARCRFHNNAVDGEWSVVQFTVSETFIQRPTLIEPTVDMVLSASNVTLKTDAFKWIGGDPAETHVSTDWQVTYGSNEFDENNNMISVTEDALNLTSYKIPSDRIYANNSYRARVRFRGEKSVSDWSETLTFRVMRGNVPSSEFQSVSPSGISGNSIGAELACTDDGLLFATTGVAQKAKFLHIFKKSFPSYSKVASLATVTEVDAERDGRCPISMSSDGKIIVVGVSASKANEDHGEVIVYRNPDDADWGTINGTTLAGLPAEGFHGLAVKLSKDGNRLIVGNGTKTLSMYSNTDQFATRTAVSPTLSAEDATCGGIGSIAMSEDGNGLVLGEANGTKFHVLAWESDNWVTKASITPKDLTEKATIKVAASNDLSIILVSVIETHKYYVYKKTGDSWTLSQAFDYTELDYSITSTRYPSGDINIAPMGSWLIFGMVGSLGSIFELRNGMYQRQNSIYGNNLSDPENYHFYTSQAISAQNDLFVGADVKENVSYFPQIKVYM